VEVLELENQETLKTRIIKGNKEEILKLFRDFATNATESDPNYPLIYAINDKNGPKFSFESLVSDQESLDDSPPGKIHFITDIQKENIEYVTKMIEANFEVRHIEGIRVNFFVSKVEYLFSLDPFDDGIPRKIIKSTNPELVEQMTNVFSKLWEGAIPADTRIRFIEEEGLEIGSTRLTLDSKEIFDTFTEFIEATKKEALIVIPSESFLQRNLLIFQKLAAKARYERISARVLAPLSLPDLFPTADSEGLMKRLNLSGIKLRDIGRSGISIALVIYDRKKMILANYVEPISGTADGVGAGGDKLALSSIITSSRGTVEALASIFDALWHQSELKEEAERARKREEEVRQREEKSAKQARLLQDILTHDLRNYNQVIKLSAELLKEECANSPAIQVLLSNQIHAIDGATALLDRARSLGKILSEQNPRLYPVDLLESVERSLGLIRRAHPEKEISFHLEPRDSPNFGLKVVADELLDEVFANLFANCVKYTNSREVFIEVVIEGAVPDSQNFVKISISDMGMGIPDALKEGIFTRYVRNARGTGLGMSIVHALVVERYGGKIRVTNRVQDDYSKGTKVEIWLPRSA
jgi:signal transduction histidine kinase